MIILFENYPYVEEDLRAIVPEWMLKLSNEQYYSILPYVGYSFSKIQNDIVFYLPKIFIDENNLAFGEIKPELLLLSENFTSIKNPALKNRLYFLSMWIFESIKLYRDSHTENEVKIAEDYVAKSIISYKKGNMPHTMMEIFYSLLDFYKENKNIFIRSKFLSNKGGRINWKKTVNKISPFIQKKKPFYLAQKTTVRQINYEDELLCLYFSVLEYFRVTYDCKIIIDSGYDLIKGFKFESLLEGKGVRLLRTIKTKYFSDVFVKLWRLLYDFFEFYSNVNFSKDYEEALLTNNYPIVFEKMVDSLIGEDKIAPDFPQYYKDQKDGKIVDHIYKDKDLFSEDEIYFIGDSKYYKTGASVSGVSIAKQFTYAKNIIQYSTNPYQRECDVKLRYRDNETEGYNITPNFFISAVIDENYRSTNENIKILGEPDFICQFENRLFDRDTLYVHRYSINFLFVLSAYISRDSYLKTEFKKRARKRFRQDIISYFNYRYLFFKIFHDATSSNKDIISANFKKYCGKMYSFRSHDDFFIMAFDRKYLEEKKDFPVGIKTLLIKDELLAIKGVEKVLPYSL